jgi:CDP-diacylglycerol--glycerol-3-phosphate 3-phosphatidyltransferase
MREADKRRGRRLIRPVVTLLSRMGVSPTAVTLAALPLSAATAYLFAIGQFLWAGVLLALAGVCDSIDGELSRATGRETETGAFLDSMVDRVSEAAVLSGVFWFYQSRSPWYALLVVGALVVSLLVSYVRARAEGLGYECKVGWFERPVRVLILLFGAVVLGPRWMPIALGALALGSFMTVVHRIAHVLGQRRRA